jgi:predicted nuclease of predicted toxin-antitoxin system
LNFVADESLDYQIVAALRRAGHQVWYVAEMAPGISDEAVLGLANRQDALLIAADKDFGELVFRQGLLTAGVIMVRLAGLSSAHKAEIVTAAVRQHESELHGSFAVVMPLSIRIRQRTK